MPQARCLLPLVVTVRLHIFALHRRAEFLAARPSDLSKMIPNTIVEHALKKCVARHIPRGARQQRPNDDQLPDMVF